MPSCPKGYVYIGDLVWRAAQVRFPEQWAEFMERSEAEEKHQEMLDFIAKNYSEDGIALSSIEEAEIEERFDKIEEEYEGIIRTKRFIWEQVVKYEAEPIIRGFLFDGSLEALLFIAGKSISKVPYTFWSTDQAERLLKEGRSDLSFLQEDFTPFVGSVVVRRDVAEEFLARIRHPGAEHDPFNDRHLALETVAGDEPAPSSSADTTVGRDPGEPSPFIALMLEATAALNLVKGRLPNGRRIQPDTIRDWLKTNWRVAELGVLTGKKIEAMTTFIRHPEDQKGGLYAGRNGRVRKLGT